MLKAVYRITRESLPNPINPFHTCTIMDGVQKVDYSGPGWSSHFYDICPPTIIPLHFDAEIDWLSLIPDEEF